MKDSSSPTGIPKPEFDHFDKSDMRTTETKAPFTQWRRHTYAALPYITFLGFCLLAALRDVFSEWMFKSQSGRMSPEFTLLIYSIATVVVCFSYQAYIGGRPIRILLTVWQRPQMRRDALIASLLTSISFLCYFGAINTPLGAGLSAFADYSITPFVASILATYLLDEKLEPAFWKALIPCLIGVMCFLYPHSQFGGSPASWAIGGTLTIISAASGSGYRVYNKRLLNQHIDRGMVLVIRFLLAVPLLTIYCFFSRGHWNSKGVQIVSVAAPFVFVLPMLLAMFSLQKMPVKQFSLIMFAVPVITFIVSIGSGMACATSWDLPAALMILGGILYYEKTTRTKLLNPKVIERKILPANDL